MSKTVDGVRLNQFDREQIAEEHIDNLRMFLQSRGIPFKDGKGKFQGIQIFYKETWQTLFKPQYFKGFFTVPKGLEDLVFTFYTYLKVIGENND